MSKDKDQEKRDRQRAMRKGGSVLVRLFHNRLLASKVDNMMDKGETYDDIIAYCHTQDFSISSASLSNYKSKREEAEETGTPLIQLLDRRRKSNVTHIDNKRSQSALSDTTEGTEESESIIGLSTGSKPMEKVYSDIEVLDKIIALGNAGLDNLESLDYMASIRAMEAKAKITNNQLAGMSIVGLREVHLRQQAREQAILEVLASFIPEDKHEEIFDAMEKAEQEYYVNFDLTDEDKRITKAIQESGLDGL